MNQLGSLLLQAQSGLQKLAAGDLLGQIPEKNLRTILPQVPDEVLDIALVVCTNIPQTHCSLIQQEKEFRKGTARPLLGATTRSATTRHLDTSQSKPQPACYECAGLLETHGLLTDTWADVQSNMDSYASDKIPQENRRLFDTCKATFNQEHCDNLHTWIALVGGTRTPSQDRLTQTHRLLDRLL